MFRSSSPLLRKSEPPVQVQDTIITAWTIRHPTRNRNDPIARAELYQLSYPDHYRHIILIILDDFGLCQLKMKTKKKRKSIKSLEREFL